MSAAFYFRFLSQHDWLARWIPNSESGSLFQYGIKHSHVGTRADIPDRQSFSAIIHLETTNA